MNKEEKAFVKAHEEYLKQLDPSDPPEFWVEHFLACAPSGNLTEFIKEWVLTLDSTEQAYYLTIFAKKGHVEIAPFLKDLDNSKDDLTRELAGDARKALEEFLAS